VDNDGESESKLLERLKTGDPEALAALFSIHRERLRRAIQLRLDPRLAGRVSGSDILQETYLDAQKRLAHYLQKPEMSFHLWLRLLTCQRVVELHRQHLGAQRRDAGREVSLNAGAPQASSVCMAAHLAAQLASPSEAAMRHERLAQLEAALEAMDPIDREVLALRHFEELTNDEVAQTLGLQKAAASNRYVRALKRLREMLSKAD
jgi:RNA polymerase sigma-70 factor (ECF subfamily)